MGGPLCLRRCTGCCLLHRLCSLFAALLATACCLLLVALVKSHGLPLHALLARASVPLPLPQANAWAKAQNQPATTAVACSLHFFSFSSPIILGRHTYPVPFRHVRTNDVNIYTPLEKSKLHTWYTNLASGCDNLISDIL